MSDPRASYEASRSRKPTQVNVFYMNPAKQAGTSTQFILPRLNEKQT